MRPDTGRTLERWTEKLADNPFKWAWRMFGLVTFVVATAGALLIRLTDRDAFPTIWSGFWWSIQTVTTVGYGDVTPTDPAGRLVGAVVMLLAIASLSILTAIITSSFIEARQLARRAREDTEETIRWRRLESRLDVIVERLDRPPGSEGTPGDDTPR